MKKSRGLLRRIVLPLMCGASMLQVGPCTRIDVQREFRDGFVAAVTGLFQIGAQSFANELFGVNG